jgi:hypothetical protein
LKEKRNRKEYKHEEREKKSNGQEKIKQINGEEKIKNKKKIVLFFALSGTNST